MENQEGKTGSGTVHVEFLYLSFQALAETGSSESPTKKSSRNSQSVSAPPLKFSVNESVRSIFTKADGGPGGGQKAKGRTRKTSVGNDNEDDIEFGVVTHRCRRFFSPIFAKLIAIPRLKILTAARRC